MYCVFLLIVVLYQVASSAKERVCSKFTYDEALLEKIIRTEMKFEQFQSEFKELRTDVSTILQTVQAFALDKLNKAAESVKGSQDVKDVKQNGESELREEVKTTLKPFQANVQDKLNIMEESIKASRNVKQRGDSITPNICFKATSVTNLNPPEGSALIFPTVLLNEGNGYNVTSGIFTAPVSGIYILTVQTCTSSGKYNAVSITVQGKEMGRLFTQDKDWSVCNSGNAIAYMDANGGAYINTRYRSGPLHYDDHRMISFAGALLN